MALPIIDIHLDEKGMGTVFVDNTPLHNGSYKLSIVSEVGKPACVTIEMWGEVRMTAPAEITLEVHDPRILHGLLDTTTNDSGGFRRFSKGAGNEED